MALVWGMINSLQLIANVPVLAVNLPCTARSFMLALTTMTNFWVFPAQKIYEGVFKNSLSENDFTPLNMNFYRLGYRAVPFVLNAAMFTSIMFFFLVVGLLAYLASIATKG